MSGISGVAKEIERKYLLSNLPTKILEPEILSFGIDHGWIPGEIIQERISYNTRNGGEYWRVIKTGRGLERIEAQEKIDKNLFDKLWALADRRVFKRRYVLGDWEIDSFSDRILYLAEIELPSVETQVTIPDWLAPLIIKEVTEDPDYLNINLAKQYKVMYYL